MHDFFYLHQGQFKEKYPGRRVPSTISDLVSALSGEVEVAEPDLPTASTYAEALVMTNHMPPLRGEAKKHAKIGHEMEEKYVQDLLKVADDGISVGGKKLEVLHVFRCGLLESKGRPHQKDSPDFVATVKVDGILCVAAMEMKCRCANATASKERERISSQGKFSYASCRSRDLRRHLQSRSEAVQCLHHAATLGVDFVIFVTGDTIGLTSGILIEHDEQLRSSYNKCIDDIYEAALKWAHDPSVPVPEEEIKAAVRKARVKIDCSSFMKSVYVWREMTKMENLPLPPAIRITPMQCQHWNYTKWGSDQKTQAAEGHRAVLPYDSRQSKVIDRMLMLILSDIHSLAKLTSAKKDLSFYSSLHGCRDAGSQRCSLEKILIEIRLALLAMIDELGGIEDDASGPVAVSDDEVSVPMAPSPQVVGIDVLQYHGTTPRRNVKRRYDDPRNVDDEAALRFKACRGIPIDRVSEDLNHRKTGARGACMLCKAVTNWWCAGCHSWVCHGGGSEVDEAAASSTSPRIRRFVRDGKECVASIGGRRKKQKAVVTAVHSCFIQSHPNFLNCKLCSVVGDPETE